VHVWWRRQIDAEFMKGKPEEKRPLAGSTSDYNEIFLNSTLCGRAIR
jgi:hypothetical protein